MTRTVFLLRHAKAEEGRPSQTDFSRALAPRGRNAVQAMAGYVRDQDLKIDWVACSPAKRTRQTLAAARKVLGEARIKFARELYLAPAADLLAYIRDLPAHVRAVMLIGHNPGLHDLAVMLSGRTKRGQTRAQLRMIEKFPTCGLCEIGFKAASWTDVERGAGTLRRFIRPADLSPERRATS